MSDDGKLGCLAGAIFAPAVLFEAWVFATLWVWFLVPAGAPAVSIREAIGVNLCASLFASLPKKGEEGERGGDALDSILRSSVRALAALIFGWIFSRLMS